MFQEAVKLLMLGIAATVFVLAGGSNIRER